MTNTQTQNNPFLVMAGLYLVVGLAAVIGRLAVDAGVVDVLPRLRWVTIHLVTIGGMTQALFGTLPSLASDEDAEGIDSDSTGSSVSDARRRWLQWLSLNAGYPLILIGMVAGNTVTALVGATAVLGALFSLLKTVYGTSAAVGSGRFFRTAPWFLVVGILAAFGMLTNVHGPGGYFGSIEAHVHANVWGFLALVAAGVLLTVLPRLLDVDLRYPRLRRVTYWGLTIGAGGLVAGPWLARHALTIGGLLVYVVGTVALLANVVGTYRASERAHPRRFALVLGAYLWLAFPVPWAPLVLLYPDTVPGAAIELAAIDGLVFGWMLQLAMAFLPLVVVATKRESGSLPGAMRSASERIGRPSWPQVGSVNAGMVLLWATAFPLFSGVEATLTFGGYLLIAAAWVPFVVELWSALAARPGASGVPAGT